MLTSPMRKKIEEQSWLEIENEDSNPTQTWRRLRDQSIEAINDLILLAKKLPEDKQKEIFSPHIIDSFMRQILYLGERHPYQDSFNPRKAEVAAILVSRGIDVNSYQYLRLNEDTPSLVKATVDHLKQCVSVCNDISYKLKLRNIEEEAEELKYRYLFSWNNMLGKEKRKLLNFIIDKIDDDQIEILQSTIKLSDKTITFDFGQKIPDFGQPADESVQVSGSFFITINATNIGAEVNIFDETNGMIWEGNLLVKESLDDHDFNIFIKRDYRTRK